MSENNGHVIFLKGYGKGKTSAAFGMALQHASAGRQVTIIQFLKGKDIDEYQIIKRLEPEIKLFSFEKSEESFEELSQERQQEEIQNVQNGFHFARKMLVTEGCDVLVLDEFLGLIDAGIISEEEFKEFLSLKQANTILIMTGINVSERVCALADDITVMM